MKNISGIIGNIATKEVLGQEICSGCGEEITIVRLTPNLGPTAGKSFVTRLNCKCEDIRLAKEAEEAHRRMQLKKIQEIFKDNSLINKSLEKATFDNYHPPTDELRQAKEIVRKFVDEFDLDQPCNLLLKGTYGTGKSHLSISATKAIVEKGYSALFLSVPKLFTKIKASYDRNTNFSEDELLELVGTVDLLVLDDIGAEYTNLRGGDANDNWSQTKLFEVMDARSGRHTIYTTNLSSAELEVKVGPRNLSRMLDNAEVVIMDGPDYRRKKF